MDFLFENLLAQKPKPDGEFWIQLIVIAVIVGTAIIKSIVSRIKATMEQTEENEEDEQTPISDRPKKRYVDDDGSFKTIEQLRAEKIKQIRAAYGIPEPPTQQEPQTVTVEEPLQPPAPEPQYIPQPAPIERPAGHPKPQKPVMFTAAAEVPAKSLAAKSKAHVSAPRPAGETIDKLLFSSPDDLRNAVIYQEILGKPLALRNE